MPHQKKLKLLQKQVNTLMQQYENVANELTNAKGYPSNELINRFVQIGSETREANNELLELIKAIKEGAADINS